MLCNRESIGVLERHDTIDRGKMMDKIVSLLAHFDNGVVVFNGRRDATKGCDATFSTMSKWGLTARVGRGKKIQCGSNVCSIHCQNQGVVTPEETRQWRKQQH